DPPRQVDDQVPGRVLLEARLHESELEADFARARIVRIDADVVEAAHQRQARVPNEPRERRIPAGDLHRLLDFLVARLDSREIADSETAAREVDRDLPGGPGVIVAEKERGAPARASFRLDDVEPDAEKPGPVPGNSRLDRGLRHRPGNEGVA